MSKIPEYLYHYTVGPKLKQIADSGRLEPKGFGLAKCCIPCDHLPFRSWALFKARDVMRGLVQSLQADQRRSQIAA
ncbi:hypothetical protein [Paucibacter soli]|uniref:hypothetical protein n=1 Tax=Paucibacter soli TaxID=3133433 RepID=UPI00309DC0DB